jgi:UMP-CMP kinase
MIKNLMHEGKLVSSEIIVRLLLKAILASGNDKFLIDGFPRNEVNRQAYEKIVRMLLCTVPMSSTENSTMFCCACVSRYIFVHQVNIDPEFVLLIDCSREEMERRILHRNQVSSLLFLSPNLSF